MRHPSPSRFATAVLAALLTAFISANAFARELVQLASKGKAQLRIVVSASASERTRKGAGTLGSANICVASAAHNST